MDEFIEFLEAQGVEVTDEMKGKIKETLEAVEPGGDMYTKEDVAKIVKDRLKNVKLNYETQIQELKDSMAGLVDAEKVAEYEAKVKELEAAGKEKELQLKRDYELQLVAKEAGVNDPDYFNYLVEKRGLKDRLKETDDGQLVATDSEGNILMEDGEKLGPAVLIDEMKEDKPGLFEAVEPVKKKTTGPTTPGDDDSADDVKKTEAAAKLAAEMGYKKIDKE